MECNLQSSAIFFLFKIQIYPALQTVVSEAWFNWGIRFDRDPKLQLKLKALRSLKILPEISNKSGNLQKSTQKPTADGTFESFLKKIESERSFKPKINTYQNYGISTIMHARISLNQ